MKILYVWDVAGVSCVLAKFQRRAGHKADVIISAQHDTFGFGSFYREMVVPNKVFDETVMTFVPYYDVIHVNSSYELAYYIKDKWPEKKVILEYHGSDARLSNRDRRTDFEREIDQVLVSTPDLLDIVDNSRLLPLPIDTDHFKLTPHKWGAVFMKADYYDTPQDVEIPFIRITPVSYRDAPKVLVDYNMYIDIQMHRPTGKEIQAHSKGGLEALATGMSILTYEREWLMGLPNIHKPEHALSILDEIYQQ